MYIDKEQQVSSAQAFTGAATVSTNVVPFTNTTIKRQVGDGEPIGFGIHVTVAAGAGSTHLFEIIQSAASNMSSPDIIASVTMLAAALPVGKFVFLPVPPGFPTKEFIALRNTATGGTTTITVSAELTLQSMADKIQTYAKGYTIT
jgi:hypothetical protein